MRLLLSRQPAVRSIYLSKELTQQSHIPAVSDIDLTIVTHDRSAHEQVRFLFYFQRIFHLLKKLFPFLGEVGIGSEPELRFFYAVRPYFNLQKRAPMQLLYGEDCLRQTGPAQPDDMLRWDALFFAVTINFHSNFMETCMLAAADVSLQKTLLEKIYGRLLDCCLTAVPEIKTGRVPEDASAGGALTLLDKTCRRFIDSQPKKTAAEFSLAESAGLAATASFVKTGMQNFFDAFYSKYCSGVNSILAVPACAENYNYRIMILLKPGTSEAEINNLVQDLQKLYADQRNNPALRYFRMHRFPLLLTPAMLELSRFPLPRAAVEILNLRTQAIHLAGSEHPLPEFEFNPLRLEEALYSSLSLIPTCIRYILWSNTVRNPQSNAVSGLVDYVCGILPMHHLALRKKIIVNSWEGARQHYQDLCPPQKLEWYNRFYERFYGKPIEDIDCLKIESLYEPCFDFFRDVMQDIAFEEKFQQLSAF